MRIQFILSEIGIGLRRNLSMTVSVVLVTFVSLTFVGVAALLQTQIGKMKDDWYDKVEVSVFLCPAHSEVPTCASGAVTEEQKADIQAALDFTEAAAADTERIACQAGVEAGPVKLAGVGGLAEMAVVGERDEVFQVAQVHADGPLSSMVLPSGSLK